MENFESKTVTGSLKMEENKARKRFESIVEAVFLLCALTAVLGVAVITIFVFIRGGPFLLKYGLGNFVLGSKWQPLDDVFGILPMIVASLMGTLGAMVMGVPVGLLTAVFLAEVAPSRLAAVIRPAVDLLAGIPSVVYGFFGLVVIVPIIDKWFGGGGNSLLAVIIILSVMILPTVVSISEAAIRAVPKEYREGSLAMGASQMQTIFKVILPAAKSGILTAVILGIGRAVGETMAVILVAGNTALVPTSILDRVRTMTANIAIEMGYAFGMHQDALFATGVVLFVFIMGLNALLGLISNKAGE
ncbi:MAG: phosphate ABC transporter permease subunit PstC [Peptostreptococcaceae bacterium]|nr:phosphate ABC transporter permease subunit PstC [Peptostreptococcaceae bacterium]